MVKTKELEFINLLYIIGALLVVLGHSTANYSRNWGYPNLLDSKFATFIHYYINTFHMPMFFTISGFIYKFNLDKGKYSEFKPFITQKAKRLLIPYALVGLFYVSPIKLAIGDYSKDNYIIKVLINIILGVQPSQLWYLLVLFNIFAIFYFVNKYISTCNNERKAYLILFVIFFSFTTFINTGISIFHIEASLNNLIFFHLGYLVCATYSTPNKIVLKSVVLLFAHLLLYIFSLFYSLPLLNLTLTFLGIAAYFYLSIAINNNFQKLKDTKIYNILRKYNLEIYLFHQQIIQILLVSTTYRLLPPWLNITLSFTISITVSLLLAVVLKQFHNFYRKKGNQSTKYF